MSIPKFHEIQVPALELLAKNKVMKLREFLQPLVEHFDLSEEEANEVYPSGNGLVFYDRISWALSFVNMAGLVDKPRRGSYAINQTAIDLLKTPDLVDEYIDTKIAERAVIGAGEDDEKNLDDPRSIDTPQEKLYTSFESIKSSVYNEILATILSKTPTAFESLVVQLLQRMGYGGEVEDSGSVTQPGSDGGIDGIIKEDILGLGRIYIQAKRYDLENSIGRPEIQKFVGALAVAQSNKGVFITTSYYSAEALRYAANLNGATSLVLIDGKQLAAYIYQYGLGMQVEHTIELKRLDAEYWDALTDKDN